MGKSNKESNFISAVAYSRNNGDKLISFVKNLSKLLAKYFGQYEIIIADDHSTDQSPDKLLDSVDSLKTGGSLSIVEMSYAQGIEKTMNAGVDLAIGDFVLQFDSVYNDYPMKKIIDVYRKCLEDNDIVAAVPDNKQKFSSKLFYKIFNKHSNIPETLTTESFMIVSRRAINRINSMNATIPYRKAIYANCGLKKKEVFYTPQSKNAKKYNYQYRKNVALDSLMIFTDIAYKIAIGASFIIMMLLIVLGIYTIIVFLSGGAISGWTTTMLVMSLAFFSIFAILTIVIKYLSLIVKLLLQKQSYMIRDVKRKNI